MSDSPHAVTTDLPRADSPELPPTVAVAAAQTGDHGATMPNPQVETQPAGQLNAKGSPGDLAIPGYRVGAQVALVGSGLLIEDRGVRQLVEVEQLAIIRAVLLQLDAGRSIGLSPLARWHHRSPLCAPTPYHVPLRPSPHAMVGLSQ